MAESDVGDGARSGENIETGVTFTAKAGNRMDDIGSGREFEDVGSHRRVRIAGDDDGGWLGFVFGAGRAASGAAYNLYGGAVVDDLVS